jgi:hypothetical protein
MNVYLLGAAAMGALLTISAPAQAHDGCGEGFYRGPHGNCHPDGYHPGPGPAHVAYVDGHYYHGHGYYYHNRWYQERYRWHDGSWRYR